MGNRTAKRIAFILSLVIGLSILPFFAQEASASPRIRVWYKITYRVKYKVSQKKKAPKLSEKKATTTEGEIYSICLNNAKAKKIKWSSSNKKIATVKRDGNWCDITAKKPGKVTITAKYKGKKYKCKLKVKRKKATAFYCSYGNTMVFKNGLYNMFFEPSIELVSFENNVYPLTLTCHIEDPLIADCKWDPDANFDLWVTPKKEGTTWLTITNSYNSQTKRIKIIVGCGYDKYAMQLDRRNLTISDSSDEVLVRISTPSDVKNIDCSMDNHICKITQFEWREGYCLCHIKPIENGTANISFVDSDQKYVPVSLAVTVKVPNKEIITDTDEINLNVGETKNLVVSPDFGPDISTEADRDIVSLKYNGKTNGGKSYILEVTGRNNGNTVITITDKYDDSISKEIPICVTDDEGGVVQVSCGRDYTALIMENGTVHSFGKNQYGGTACNGQTDVIQVSCGEFHTGIVKKDGSLWMCGRNYYGELGNGKSGAYQMSNNKMIKIMDGVVQVSCGGSHTGILKEDGSLWMCGWNRDGQLGDGTYSDKKTPVKVMDDVAQVECGGCYTGIVKKDGSLWMCGWNRYGELGNGTSEGKVNRPVKIMDGVVQVSCGEIHTGIIKEDGSLWMCGFNYYGQLGDGTKDNKNTPVKVMDNVAQVDCGVYGCDLTGIVKQDGSLQMYGYGSYGQKVGKMDGVVQVSCGKNHTGILKDNGVLYLCGYSLEGALGDSRYQKPDTSPVSITQ